MDPSEKKPPGYRPLPLARDRLEAVQGALRGPEHLDSLLQDFYQRMADDLMIGFFFAGKDIALIARKQGDFLKRALGMSSSYQGKAPADAHGNLPPILPGHFDRRLRLLEETLRQHQLPEDAIQAWLGFENAFRKAIEAPSTP
jgi:truncated hemoglobin YjbI